MPYYLCHFLNDESGATAIEYAFIAMLIALACVAGLTAIGTTLSSIFVDVNSGFE